MAQKIFTEKKAEDFLKKYIPVANSYLCKTKEQALKYSKKLGPKIVMKIISKDALHKSDIGGVKISENIEKDFDSLMKIVNKRKLKLDGILLQEYIEGTEVILGIKKDPTFGHVIMFGLGGVLIELVKDVTFRICPIDNKEAEKMISDLKTKKLLFGYRGNNINKKILIDTLIKVSKIPIKNKKIEELDINPFIINEKIGKVSDARIVFN